MLVIKHANAVNLIYISLLIYQAFIKFVTVCYNISDIVYICLRLSILQFIHIHL